MARRVGLSKSRVLLGLQCHKRLWWTVHEPDAPELQVDEQQQATFDRGSRVGEVARTYVPGGVLIDAPYHAFAERFARTRRALADGAPAVYEAAFQGGGVFVAVDILERQGRAFRLIEVKSSTSVKEVHLPDVAVQAHVLRRSGLDLVGLEVMHLDRACVYPDLSNLFVRVDVTDAVEALEGQMPAAIAAQRAMLAGPRPDRPTGPHCSTPYECPFLGRCWPELPAHHVSTLHRIGARSAELEAQGYVTIHDLPAGVPLGPVQARQRRAVQEGRLVVEPGLAEALEGFVPPLAFLDFETVGLAIPVWEGCHPYDAVPAQFSCHVQAGDGAVTHHEWLADGPGDPRPALAEHLVRACRGARTVVAYNASFERRCLEHLAGAVPALAGPLLGIADRLVDLLPIVRDHVYHPDFGGSFGLKSVLPALVPELSHEGLAIADGATASLALERLLFAGDETEAGARDDLRSALLRYCCRDSLGMVGLHRALSRLAGR